MSNYLERILAIHSSPAICGIKASNLISVLYSDDIISEIEELNNKYNPKIYFKVLKINKTHALVLVFKKSVFECHLNRLENKSFLKSLGYDITSINSMLLDLTKRINDVAFPHEIGIFLGYDLEDTKSFLNGGDSCLYVGYWKVYSNVEEKKILFNKFSKCTQCVLKLVDKGYSLENFMR